MSVLPAIFFGHGTPMNAVETNDYTEAWSKVGRELSRPRAILALSAHWFVPGTRVTSATRPVTIHDFGGFPQPLYDITYPAPGDPALAQRVRELLAPIPVTLDDGWGLDHGTWSVLVHAFPAGDIPVVQLSLDATQGPAFFFELGERLRPLRDDGVLLMGSGNVVHNLRAFAAFRMGRGNNDGSAARFEEFVRERVTARDFGALVHYENQGEDARAAVPTEDHYVPLLPILGAARDGDPVSFPTAGVPAPGISMLSVRVG
jgi:4,5-DOPA dioxygenase extradiol